MIGMKKAILFLITAISLTSLLTCSNPFSAGLGDKVDLEAPSLEIKSHRNGDAVGSSFELAGTVTDDGTVESLKISLDSPDNIIGSASIDGSSWSYTYDSSELTDGDHEFTFVAKDNTDKSVSANLLLTVDNNPPTVMVNVPAAYGADKEFNKNITIKGDAADTTRVKEVFISLYDASDNSTIIEKASATGTTSWYYTFNSETITANILQGNYYFFVTAEDYSGNSNDYFYHFADIYESAQDPANLPNVEDINEADYGGVPLSSAIFKDTITLEDLRITTADGQNMLININPNSDKPQFTFISPSIVESPADPLEENVFSSSVRLSGFVEDDDGVNFDTLQIKISKIDSSYNVTSVEVPWTTIPAEKISGTQWTFEPSLEDGDYKVDLRVEDIYGTEKTTEGISIIPFRISSLAPTVTITNPIQGSYVGSSSAIDVQADIRGLSSSGTVEIDPTGDDDWTDALTMNGSGDGLYSRTMTSGNEFTPMDGQITFKIRAGIEGSYGTGTLQLTGDITRPTVKVEVPSENQTVNGVFNIAGTSSDNNIVRRVYVWLEENADPATAPPDDFTTWNIPDGSDLYNWIYNLDTATKNSGAHTIHVKAVDAAGNQSSDYSKPFTIDQESDRPVISLSNMVIGGTSLENGLGKDASVIGLVEDDDNVDVSSIEVRVNIDGDSTNRSIDLNNDGDTSDANEIVEWVPVSDPPGSDTRIVDWSHSLINVPQGSHSLQIRAHDTLSDDTNNLSNTNFNEIVETQFIIDYGPPDLIITEPANGTVFNSSFSIYGTAQDANGVNDVLISINGGELTSIMDAADTGNTNVPWNYDFTVDPAGSNDGDYTYQIRAVDTAGGKTSLDRQLIVDATAPQITYELPENGSTVNGSSVPVRGTASDNRDVKTIYQYIEIEGTSAPSDMSQWTVLSGTYTWQSTFDSLAAHNSKDSAIYVIYAKAEDNAGNISNAFTRTITVDQTTDRPLISLNDIDKSETIATNNVLSGASSITGTVEDDDLIDPSLFSGNSIEIKIDEGNWVPVSDPPQESKSLVSWKHDISTLTEGEHTVSVRARDNKSDGTVGTSSDEYSTTSSFNWAIEDGDGVNGIPFILNIGPPTITVDTPNNYSYHNSDVLISGLAQDANGVKSIQISLDNGSSWFSPDTFSSGSESQWDYTLTVDGNNDGTYNYLIRAIDEYDLTALENGQFFVDATSPNISIDQPNSGQRVNGEITIKGTAEDSIKLERVYLHVGPSSGLTPLFPDDYILLSEKNNWSYTYDTSAIITENYTVRAVSVDAAENNSSLVAGQNEVVFTIDQETDRPNISFTSVDEAGTYVQNELSGTRKITGEVYDDDGVDITSIEYQLYKYSSAGTQLLVDWSPISETPEVKGAGYEWTHIIPDTFVDTQDTDEDGDTTETLPIGDGRYQIHVRAADINDGGTYSSSYGFKESNAVKIGIDENRPVISLTSPSQNGSYTNSSVDITGTTSDVGGISEISIKYSTEDTPRILYTDTTETYSKDVTWSPDTFSVDTTNQTTDGRVDFTISVTDAFGNISTLDRNFYVDTQEPSVTVDTPSTDTAIVNGTLKLDGFAEDLPAANGFVGRQNRVHINISPSSPSDPAMSEYEEANGDGFSWYYSVGTTSLDDGLYDASLIAEDEAGNYSSPVTRTFEIKQSSDKPTIYLTSIDETGTYLENLIPNTNRISGTVQDDDAVDQNSIQIRVDVNNDGDFNDTDESWSDVNDPPDLNDGNVNWSHSFSALSDGQYQLDVRAGDINYNQDYTNEFQVGAIGPVQFSIDTAIPSGTVNYPAQGAYLKDPGDGTITISGTASDASGIKKVEISVDGGIAVETNGTESWSYEYTISSEGQVPYQIIITDNYNKPYTIDRSFTIDTTAPVPSFTQPGASETLNGSIEIKGDRDTEKAYLVPDVYFQLVVNETVPEVPTDPVLGDWSALGWTRLSGTDAWSQRVNTTDYDDGKYDVYVYALDNADNLSSPTILKDLTFDQSTDNPVITINNLADPPTINLFDSGGVISGNVIDDDTVNASTISISLDGGASWNQVSNPGSNGTTVNWSHNLDTEDETATANQVRIKASDIGDVGNGIPVRTTIVPAETADPYVVAIDRSTPSVSIDKISYFDRYDASSTSITGSSMSGALINNNFDVTITASDVNGIKDVEVLVNDAVASTVDNLTNNGNGTWTFSKSIAVDNNGDDGPMSLDVRVTDVWDKQSTDSLSVVIDTTEPTVTYTKPYEGENVNGDVTIYGTAFDQNSITDLSITGGISNNVDLGYTGTLTDWRTSFDSYAQIDQGNAEDPDNDNIWQFPVHAVAYDAAGNKNQSAYAFHENGDKFQLTDTTALTLDLDPESDKPVIVTDTLQPAVTTDPSTQSTSVAGTIVMQSSVTDDDSPAYVEIYADLDDNGILNDTGTYAYDLNSDGETTDPFETEATPLIVNISNGVWTTLLNENSEFGIATMEARNVSSPTGYLRFYIAPYDINGIKGDTVLTRVYIDATPPDIKNLEIDNEPLQDGKLVSGTEVRFTGTIEDDAALDTINDIKISFDGGTTYEQLPVTASGSPPPYIYTFDINIDTTQYYPSNPVAPETDSGILNISLRTIDETQKQTTTSFSLNVDNSRPGTQWNDPETLPYSGTPPNELYTFYGDNSTPGSQNRVFGSASDTGLVSGIEKVLVYFVKDDQYIVPVKDSNLSSLVVDIGTETNTNTVYDQAGNLQTIPFTSNSDYSININNRLEQGQYDSNSTLGDQDGFLESLSTEQGYDEWYAYFDSTVLPDGPVKVYYVAYDEALNNSYGFAEAQVSNNPPAIPKVEVGNNTINDATNQAKVSGTETFTLYAEDNEGINVEEFILRVDKRYNVADGGSIGTEDTSFTSFYYDYSGTGSQAKFDSTSPASGSATTASASISINTDTATYDSGYWYLFQAEAYDTDGNTVSREFYVWVNNNDNIPAQTTLYDFDQNSVDGVTGHVESSDDSGDGDADLSGSVIVSGTIYDDTSVDSLELQYFDGTDWNSITTISSFGTPIIEDPINGNTYEWSYEWDTGDDVAGVTPVAANDVQIRAVGNDSTGNTPASDDIGLTTVDIVPYITSLETGFDAGLLKYGQRSAKGVYPIAVGSIITINGFNLPGTATGAVNIGGDSGVNLDSSGDRYSLQVDLLDTTEISGELRVTTNGVNSSNNTNTNSLAHNQEDNLFNDKLTDDRMIALWDVRSHSTLTNKTYPSMSLNANGDGVDWIYVEGGNYLRFTNGDLDGSSYLTNGFAIAEGSFAYNSSGTLMWLYLHDASWSTDTSWPYFGSVQWGRDVIDPDNTEAYNWNQTGTARLGIGNMSFEGDDDLITASSTEPVFNITGQDSQLRRYEDLKIKVDGYDDTSINHVTYRDVSNSSKGIVYYAFKVGTNLSTSTTALDTGWDTDLTKTISSDQNFKDAGGSNQIATGVKTPIDHRGNITTDNATYYDMSITSTGAAVAVWYDATSGSLKLAYNETPLVDADNWVEHASEIATSAGAHVAMDIDPADGIHLAYLDASTGYMKYSYLPSYSSSPTKTVTVDALLSNGQFNSITTRNFGTAETPDYRPIISTFSTSFDGTKGSVRTAWPMTAADSVTDGANSDEKYTGSWEVMFVPATVVPKAEKTFIEKLNNDDFTVGYNGTNLEETTFLGFGYFPGMY